MKRRRRSKKSKETGCLTKVFSYVLIGFILILGIEVLYDNIFNPHMVIEDYGFNYCWQFTMKKGSIYYLYNSSEQQLVSFAYGSGSKNVKCDIYNTVGDLKTGLYINDETCGEKSKYYYKIKDQDKIIRINESGTVSEFSRTFAERGIDLLDRTDYFEKSGKTQEKRS